MTSHQIPISSADSSQIGQARRKATALAKSLAFSDVRAGELSILVTEAARNIAAHANEGHLILTPWAFSENSAGIDVFALDRGPGIRDIHAALEDGYSTAGTAGQGLGAITRLASFVEIYSNPSVPNSGTALFARVKREVNKADPAQPQFGAISIPLATEQVCGDSWHAELSPTRSILIVADGLGHGPIAAEASVEAIRIFKDSSSNPPDRILTGIHAALAKTRGAAVSIAELLPESQTIHFAGAGNVAGVVLTPGKPRNMVSMNGTVGHSVAKFQQFSYPCERNALLILHSDGLTSRWNLDLYPGLASRHPALIAAVLYRDFCRGRDDVTILALRNRLAQPY